jgi:hypothetical protein
MDTHDESRATEALLQSVDAARTSAVTAIRGRWQHCLVEPTATDLVTIVTCDLGLLLDEIERLQAIRRQQDERLARQQAEAPVGSESPDGAQAPIEQANEVAVERTQKSKRIASLRQASADLQTALSQEDWRTGLAALETIRGVLETDAKSAAETQMA